MQLEILPFLIPSDTAVSAARTCYYPHGLVRPEQSTQWKAKEGLLSSIFKAGHHTTLQHTHITLLIEGMSRHLIWRLLHSHPYYNSEQVSQRYAKMKSDAFVIPSKGNGVKWQSFYNDIFSRYEKLIDMLVPVFEQKLPKFQKNQAIKRAQEVARYVLPQGMSAYLYHTINLVTALRYIGAVKALPEVKNEAQIFVDLLEKALLEADPSLKPLIEDAKKAKVTFPVNSLEKFKSRHIIAPCQNVFVTDYIPSLDYEVGANYGEALRFGMLYPDGAILGSFNTYMKLSLSADAQNQRHRRSPAIRPLLLPLTSTDYYTPTLLFEYPEILAFYDKTIEYMYAFLAEMQNECTDESVYALPNAHLIEIIEHNDFASFFHKTQMRLCYNAQQEIFDLVYAQVEGLKTLKAPEADSCLPPCCVRQQLGIYPLCPEGNRFCGIKVWQLPFEKYKREF